MELVTYWKNNGTAGLRSILNQSLGGHIIDVHDFLARNAFLQGAMSTTGYLMYSGASGPTNLGNIQSTDLFDINVASDIQLGMKYREVAQAIGPGGQGGSVFCYTSPGVIYDIQRDPEWVDVRKYQGLQSILNYEVGEFKGVRFVEHPRMTLWNCGAITVQVPVTVPISAGDGSPNPSTTKVDGTYGVGQSGAAHYITYGTETHGAESSFAVNDIVTIHVSRTATYGVTDGVNPFDGLLHNRRIVSIDTSANRIAFDKPIFVDMLTDLTGGGVYAYITKGQNIHASLFIGAPNAIVAGVARPIRMHTPPPIDDLESMYRFAWDDRIGYQPFAPEVFEVVLSAGSTRVKGAVQH